MENATPNTAADDTEHEPEYFYDDDDADNDNRSAPDLSVFNPPCDFEAAREYLRLLDPTAEKFTFFTADDVELPDEKKPGKLKKRKNPKLLRTFHEPFDDAMAAKLAELNNRDAGVFICINATDLKGREKKNMRRVRAVWHEQDDPAVEPVFPGLPPSLVVESSPGKKHRYWFVDQMKFPEHAAVMQLMVDQYGSDKNAKDSTRVLRLPGFWHCKNPNKRHRVRTIGGVDYMPGWPATRHTYTREQVLETFPPKPKPEAEQAPPREPGTFDRAKLFQVIGYIDANARETWLDVGFALHHESRGSLEGKALWDDWSANAPDKYDAADLEKTWKSFSGRTGKPITVGTLYHMAKAGGWKEPPRDKTAPFTEIPDAEPEPGADDADDKLLERVSDIDKAALLADAGNALIRPWLMRGNTGMMYGDSTAGKTFTALDMAFHLALGKDWHGHRIKKRVPVLYVCLEGTKGFQRRTWAAELRHGDPGDYFSRLTVHVSLAKGKGDADAAKGAETIIRAARRLAKRCGEPCAVIYIDTLRRATAGDDENATDAIMFFIEKRCGHIQRETGAAVFYLHHTNRQGTFAGNSSNTGGNDVVIRVDRNGEDAERNVWLEKDKDGEEKHLLTFELDVVPLGEDDEKVPITSCVVRKVAYVPKTAAKRARKIGKTERIFREAFDAVRAAGKTTERTTSDGCPVGVTAEIPDVQAAFLERYTTGEPERQWRRVLDKLPAGFEIAPLRTGKVIWSPI